MKVYKPGLLKNTLTFLRIYKIRRGKGVNTIAFESEAQNKEFATSIVLETHEHWKSLINGTTPRQEIQTVNLSVKGSPYRIRPGVLNVPPNNPLSPAPIDNIYDEWLYVSVPDNQTIIQ